MSLLNEQSVSIPPGMQPLSKGEAAELAREVPDWMLKEDSIEREFTFKDFRQAMEFVNRVADIANTEDHHPDIYISYNKVRLVLSTHKIGGLSRNDFIVAAKVDCV
jgi:4a-hydroxytetrahydrobiopterin dehydratase